MPEQADVVTVHNVLEEAFTDHFNYFAETFDEFTARLREDPGHRWDHWWIAELVDAAQPPARPECSSAPRRRATTTPRRQLRRLPRRAAVRTGTRRRAAAAQDDHRRRGRAWPRPRRARVDADSPTGAVDLYTSTGFRTLLRHPVVAPRPRRGD